MLHDAKRLLSRFLRKAARTRTSPPAPPTFREEQLFAHLRAPVAAVEAWLPVAGAWPAGLVVASAGTDGEDGPTDAAGGMVDREVVQQLVDGGVDVGRAVMRCDAYSALAAADGLIRTGPTGTNVADVRIVLARA